MEQNKFKPSIEKTIENMVPNQDSINSAIENVKKLLESKKEDGISPEEIEKTTGMKFDDFIELLKGEKIDIRIDNTNFKEFSKNIGNYIGETEGESEGGMLRKITNKKWVRAAFVSLMLLLKFGQTQASGTEKKDINKDPNLDKTKLEVSAPTNIEPGNTYHADAKEFDNSLKALPLKINLEKNNKSIKLELGNYFDNDLSDIPNESEIKIQSAVQNILDQITPENVDEFSKNVITIYAHSNELKTNNPKWEKKNYNLSKARANVILEKIEPIFKNYVNDKLGKDVEKIRDMKINIVIPSFPGAEEGVQPLTEFINEKTGQKYTESEIKNVKDNNPELYKKMLAEARGIELIIEAPKNSESHIRPIEPKGVTLEHPQSIELETPKFQFENLTNYDNVVLAFDDSPSTTNDNLAVVAKIISNQKINDPKIKCLIYSDKIESAHDFKNLEDATGFIKNIEHNGNRNEKALKCVYDFLKKQPDQPRNNKFEKQKENVYLYWTDENFQGVSKELIEEIRKLEKQKNYVTFGYISDAKNKTLTEYSLDKIEKGLDKSLIEKASPKVMQLLDQFSAKINSLEKQAEMNKEKLAKANSDELKEIIRDKISKIEDEIKKNKTKLEKLTNDYESGSVEKLFNNETLKNNFKVDRKDFNKELEITLKPTETEGVEVQLASLK